MRDDLKALAERCEAADGPSRELDAEIAVALNLPWDYAADWGPRGMDKPVAQPYTASLDAAMMLLPEGYMWGIGSTGSATLAKPVNGLFPVHRGNAATPALALTAACLRAIGGESHD